MKTWTQTYLLSPKHASLNVWLHELVFSTNLVLAWYFLLRFCLSLTKSCLNVCKCVCLKTIFLSFSYLFSWLPVSKYVCMYICLKDCSQTCLKTFFCVYKKTLTHVRLTINFIPCDKIYLYFVLCLLVWMFEITLISSISCILLCNIFISELHISGSLRS